MINITSNIASITTGLIASLTSLENPETVSRAVASAMMPEIRERIHVRGENSAGTPIGVYTNAYLKLREKKYNRTSDNSVIISLTRQLENSYILSPTEKGYTIGFATPLSFDKATWMEEKYGKIWDLTTREQEQAQSVAIETTNELLKRGQQV